MNSDRLITVAIHTYDKAHQLKSILESEGLKVVLQNVNLTNPVISSGIRVRIPENELPLALRVIENIEIFAPSAQKDADVNGAQVLVPVDFSDYSLQATALAFHIAEAHKGTIHLLHTFADPIMTNGAALQLSATMTFEPDTNIIEEEKEDRTLRNIAKDRMKEFENVLREKIKDGVIPPVKFTSEISEGLPEEVIDDYATTHHPLLIVMGTQGTNKENRNLVGSVTAEVLDNCRTTVFTVPQSTPLRSLADLHKVVYFTTTQQEDILALDALYRVFPDISLDVTLVGIPSRKMPDGNPAGLNNLLDYCKKNYPAYTFAIAPMTMKNAVEDFSLLQKERHIDLIVLPTRRKNIFARIFNPTLAHKLLFHSDIPMMSIPV